jgi:hypothetical protein
MTAGYSAPYSEVIPCRCVLDNKTPSFRACPRQAGERCGARNLSSACIAKEREIPRFARGDGGVMVRVVRQVGSGNLFAHKQMPSFRASPRQAEAAERAISLPLTARKKNRSLALLRMTAFVTAHRFQSQLLVTIYAHFSPFTALFTGRCSLLTDHCFSVAAWACQGIDVGAGARAVVPHLHGQIEVEDVRRSNSAAGAINRKHRVAIDFVEVNVLQHGAAPV